MGQSARWFLSLWQGHRDVAAALQLGEGPPTAPAVNRDHCWRRRVTVPGIMAKGTFKARPQLNCQCVDPTYVCSGFGSGRAAPTRELPGRPS